MPEDPAPNVSSFNTAASKWKEEHLNLLNVEYTPTHHYPIEINPEIPPEVSQRVPLSITMILTRTRYSKY